MKDLDVFAEELTSKICMGKLSLTQASDLLVKALLSVREEAIRECADILNSEIETSRYIKHPPGTAEMARNRILKLLTPAKEGTNKGWRA